MAERRNALTPLWRRLWYPTGVGRLVRYGCVGAGGVVVNMGVLWVLRQWDLLGPLRAPTVAIECAIVHNFLWNELWVFRDRTQHTARLWHRLGRLLHFHGICALGATLHLGIVWLVALRWQWPYMWTNLLAIAVVAVWNYGVNTTWTWTGGTRKQRLSS